VSSYRDAGVDIQAGNTAAQLMASAVRSTHGPAVLAGMGAFGGCLDLATALGEAGLAGEEVVLVASTDGVGTKTMIAAALGRYDTVGQDLVNHCVNDILAQGARPLFFMDYFASAKIDPQHVAEIVGGVAQACRAIGCALLGGETAEMPDIYAADAFDLAGTIVGVAPRSHLLPRGVRQGDVLIALPSNGLHTNGYSLARRVFTPRGYSWRPDLLGGQSVGEALLAVHRPYLAEVTAMRAAGVDLHGLAHITGGGLTDNLPRMLPDGAGALLRRGAWDVPPILDLLVQLGELSEEEAYHALNMGLGMLAAVAPESVDAALRAAPEARVVGEVIGGRGVTLA
jgi:phosphoribosylformylglycinamidine cyclo-ligase